MNGRARVSLTRKSRPAARGCAALHFGQNMKASSYQFSQLRILEAICWLLRRSCHAERPVVAETLSLPHAAAHHLIIGRYLMHRCVDKPARSLGGFGGCDQGGQDLC